MFKIFEIMRDSSIILYVTYHIKRYFTNERKKFEFLFTLNVELF